MKQIAIVVLLLLVLLSSVACAPQQPTAAEKEVIAEEKEVIAEEKEVIYKVVNVSGDTWVMYYEPSTSFEELDAFSVAHFDIIEHEEIFVESGVVVYYNKTQIGDFSTFVETSPSTYTLTFRAAVAPSPAGSPEDLQAAIPGGAYWDIPGVIRTDIHTITISGTYNEKAVVEWDGVSFKQVE